MISPKKRPKFLSLALQEILQLENLHFYNIFHIKCLIKIDIGIFKENLGRQSFTEIMIIWIELKIFQKRIDISIIYIGNKLDLCYYDKITYI